MPDMPDMPDLQIQIDNNFGLFATHSFTNSSHVAIINFAGWNFAKITDVMVHRVHNSWPSFARCQKIRQNFCLATVYTPHENRFGSTLMANSKICASYQLLVLRNVLI